MALETAVGQFQLGTGVATTTVSVAGLPFQPKVVIFSWCGRTSNGQANMDHKFGHGYMVSVTDRGGSTAQSDHGPTNMVCDGQVFDDACIKMLTTAGGVDGAADFSSFNSDGFTVVIDSQFDADYTINFLAIGGDDLTNVASQTASRTAAAGTGSADYTSIGFQPDAMLIFGSGDANVNTTDVWSLTYLGAVAGGNQAVLMGGEPDGPSTSATFSYCKSGECVATTQTTDAVSTRAAWTGWLSNGFTLNWTEVTVTTNCRALCFKGGQWAVGDILSQTDTSNTSESGLAFTPKALLVASHNKAQSTADTTQAHDERCLGFAVDASNRNYVSIIDKDAAGTADIGVAQGNDAMYANQSTAAPPAIEGLMDLVSMNSDGFTFVMDDADPAQAFVWYLAAGSNAGAGGQPTMRRWGGVPGMNGSGMGRGW